MLRQIIVGVYQSFELYSIFNVSRRCQVWLAVSSQEICSQISALGQENWLQFSPYCSSKEGHCYWRWSPTLVGDVTRRNRVYRAQWRKQIDLGISFSLELGPNAPLLETHTSPLSWNQLNLNSGHPSAY